MSAPTLRDLATSSPRLGIATPVCLSLALSLALSLLASPNLRADGGVVFTDIAQDSASGLAYQRAPSDRLPIFEQLTQIPALTPEQALTIPYEVYGLPGVALFDHDLDGDLDIYVANGPHAANSLFSNQLVETGELSFVDVASARGVAAVEQESSGVCVGDIDNDGDPDLYVVGTGDPNLLFQNQGDGTFVDITAASGLAAGSFNSTGCSFGDVKGDGLLDVVVANIHTVEHGISFLVQPFLFTQHNQLFLNQGSNIFLDVSETSGIQQLAAVPPGAAGLTWAVAMVDYDLDGDLDIFSVDEQGDIVPAKFGGVDISAFRLFQNDGTGSFTDVSAAAGTERFGGWMGISFGDYNCDRHLDFFGTNFGDYSLFVGFQTPGVLGDYASRWLLSNGDGTFRDPGVGELVATPFGWGTSSLDYDNDGDTDIYFEGGLLSFIVDMTNPGTIFQNQGCTAAFTYDAEALAGSLDHRRRQVRGVASGDLDGDGFLDLVSVSDFDIPENGPILPYPLAHGSPFDALARFMPLMVPAEDPSLLSFFFTDFAPGTLSVEISSGDNSNGWVEVTPRGSVGTLEQGRVNRDGIGAMVIFDPEPGGAPSMRPVVSGGSHASQESLTAHFGLGDAASGTVEVYWPGGVRNRLYNVRHGERLVFPEIPCSIADDDATLSSYRGCVRGALDALEEADVLSPGQRGRFFASAMRAFLVESKR